MNAESDIIILCGVDNIVYMHTICQSDRYNSIPHSVGSPPASVWDPYHRTEEHWSLVLQTGGHPRQVRLPLWFPLSQVQLLKTQSEHTRSHLLCHCPVLVTCSHFCYMKPHSCKLSCRRMVLYDYLFFWTVIGGLKGEILISSVHKTHCVNANKVKNHDFHWRWTYFPPEDLHAQYCNCWTVWWWAAGELSKSKVLMIAHMG